MEIIYLAIAIQKLIDTYLILVSTNWLVREFGGKKYFHMTKLEQTKCRTINVYKSTNTANRQISQSKLSDNLLHHLTLSW